MSAGAGLPEATEEQHLRLRRDVDHVRALRSRLLELTGGRFDQRRVLAMVAATSGSERYLPYTVPMMIGQIAMSGRFADVVIGLNDGYECPAVVERLGALPHTEVVHLHTGDKPGGNVPSRFFADPARRHGYLVPQDARGHRVFAVHQKAGPYAAGKTRVLDDVCHGLVLDSIEGGWLPPAFMLVFDHESIVQREYEDPDALLRDMELVRELGAQGGVPADVLQRLVERQRREPAVPAPARPAVPVDFDSPGIDLMLQTLHDEDADIVSLGWRNCPYDTVGVRDGLEVDLPDLAAETSPLHRITRAFAGLTPGTMTLSSGATLGRLEVLLALHATMFATYPGLLGEDSMSSVLAYHARFRVTFRRDVYNTNRCPALHETLPGSGIRAWKDQYARWFAVVEALERLYGRENIEPTRGLDGETATLAALALCAETLRRTGDAARGMALLEELDADMAEIRTLARPRRYELTDPRSSVVW